MTIQSYLQLGLFILILLLLVKPLGGYMAAVFTGRRVFVSPVIAPLEKFVYRIAGIRPEEEMSWKRYAAVMLLFNLAGLALLYLFLRLQGLLPLNPQGLSSVNPDLAFNIAVSFATNTNWQSYSGETTLGYFNQMLGLGVQNFLSAATGVAILLALVRGLVRHSTHTIGNYWADMTRSILYVLIPLAVVLAVLLVSQGVVQTFNGSEKAVLVQPVTDINGQIVDEQLISLGPAASQIAIKQLGTNGGGFFNVNSAHPFENPTPFSNFLEMLSILLIPAALCYSFGKMVGDTRKGWALLAAMTIIFLAVLSLATWAEQSGNPAFTGLNIDQTAGDLQSGGNLEGKEVRFGIANSALWATATAAASNGSVNAMHDSMTPLGGLAPLWLIQMGEVIFGGTGSGLYGLLAFVIIAVFVGGLMIGRTPEYLGKKIEAFEMKMACLMVLTPVLVVLIGSALAVVIPAARDAVLNPGAHGFSEILYSFSSAANNNGSAFAGLSTNNLFFNITLGIAMLIGRYWLAVPVLAIAGSLATRKKSTETSGTLPTHTPLFVFWLIAVVLIVGALSFLPALSLGPIVEHLMR